MIDRGGSCGDHLRQHLHDDPPLGVTKTAVYMWVSRARYPEGRLVPCMSVVCGEMLIPAYNSEEKGCLTSELLANIITYFNNQDLKPPSEPFAAWIEPDVFSVAQQLPFHSPDILSNRAE